MKPLIWRKKLKVDVICEVIDGKRIYELYVSYRKHGGYIGWGGGR